MRIKLNRVCSSRQEIINRVKEYFNNYTISSSTIKIFMENTLVATINLDTKIMEVDLRAIRQIGTHEQNLRVAKRIDDFACI